MMVPTDGALVTRNTVVGDQFSGASPGGIRGPNLSWCTPAAYDGKYHNA